MYEYKEVHFQRKEYIIVGRKDGNVMHVDMNLRPLNLCVRLAELRGKDDETNMLYSVEDADTGEVMWPKEEEDDE